MPISFNEFPNNIRVPFVGMEFDNSGALTNSQNQPYQSLMIGSKLSTGTAEDGALVRVSNVATAKKLFGAGSMLYDMCAAYLENDVITPLYCLAIPDAEAGVKATATITITGTASEAGTFYGYLSGKRFMVKIAVGATNTTLATNIASAINAGEFVASATAESGVVTLTAKNAGSCGNDIDFRINYYAGEVLPAGVAVEITNFAGGSGNPDILDYISIIEDRWFNGIACGYTDVSNLMILKEEMETRWGPLKAMEGVCFAAIRGTSFSDLCSRGEAHNSPHLCIPHAYGIPNAPWAMSAAVCAIAMYYGNIDKARPFQTLEIDGILAPADKDRFPRFTERNQLLYSGITTWYVDDDNSIRMERMITTYKRTPNGADDISYLDVNTMLTLGYLRWDLCAYIKRKYPRHKLANDGTRYGVGQAIVTPLLMKAEIINRFVDWEARGLVESFEQFKSSLIVERNQSDPNRLDVLMKPDLINQFRIGAILNQFILHSVNVQTVA